jgi:hypothetical protein
MPGSQRDVVPAVESLQEARRPGTLVAPDDAAARETPFGRSVPPTPPSQSIAGPWMRRHALFLLLLAAGASLRVLVGWAFSGGLLVSESISHLVFVASGSPSTSHPDGYGILELTPLSWLTSAPRTVTTVQHMLGLTAAITLYMLLLRWGVWRWLAAVATAPLLLDPYIVASEHLILPDSVFLFLMVLAIAVLTWHAVPSIRAVAAAGLMLGLASLVMVSGVWLALVALVFVLIAAPGDWRARRASALALALGFVAVVGPYVAFYYDSHGSLSVMSGAVRVASPNSASTGGDNLLDGLGTLTGWSPSGSSANDIGLWRFGNYEDPGSALRSKMFPLMALHLRADSANAVVAYQAHAFTPGLALLGCLVLGLLAAAGVGRARGSRMQTACLLLAATPTAVLLGAGLSGAVTWRNVAPAIALLPAAGALGLTALLRGRRSPSAARPQVDVADAEAIEAFDARYDRPRLKPVAVVIAAYNEIEGLPDVLSTMPPTVCGLDADVIVVDDGSTDGTAQALEGHRRAYVVASGVNRGQGAAMRLGYRIARDHGARYIITTDADGQYDPADFPTVLAPILDGRADFVTGSRRRGRQETHDSFRRTGVHVFAWVVSAMTGQWTTDTSFGLRAMRAELTAAVTLNQPQYQSSELLLGVHSHGFRVTEVPGSMRMRSAGSTKKGRNLVYGARYARVVWGTWWREGCPSPAVEHAPALAKRAGTEPAPPTAPASRPTMSAG